MLFYFVQDLHCQALYVFWVDGNGFCQYGLGTFGKVDKLRKGNTKEYLDFPIAPTISY